jgi:hypothetical protein
MEAKRNIPVSGKDFSEFTKVSDNDDKREFEEREYNSVEFYEFEKEFTSHVRRPDALPVECLKAQIGDFAAAYRYLSKHHTMPHSFIGLLGSDNGEMDDEPMTTFTHREDMDTLGDVPRNEFEEVEYQTREGFPEKGLMYHLILNLPSGSFALHGATRHHLRWLCEHGSGHWDILMSDEEMDNLSPLDLKLASEKNISLNEGYDYSVCYDAVIVCFESCEGIEDVRVVMDGVSQFKEFYLVDWELDRFNSKSKFKTYSVEEDPVAKVPIVLAHYERGKVLGGQYWPAYVVEELARGKRVMHVSRFIEGDDRYDASFRVFRFYFPNVVTREEQVLYVVTETQTYVPQEVEFEIMELEENKRVTFQEPKDTGRYAELDDPIYVAGYNSHCIPFCVKYGIFYWKEEGKGIMAGEYRPMIDADWESGYCRLGEYDVKKKKYEWVQLCDFFVNEENYHARRDYCYRKYPKCKWVVTMTLDACKLDKIGTANGSIISGQGEFDSVKLMWNKDSTYDIPVYYQLKDGPIGVVTGNMGLEMIKAACSKSFFDKLMTGRKRFQPKTEGGFTNYEDVLVWSKSYPQVVSETMRLDVLLAHYKVRHGLVGIRVGRNQKNKNNKIWLRKDFVKLFQWDRDTIRGNTRVKLIVERKKGEG